ncbi:nascent polypeptide-associated complex subunit alpha, muscle-specific form-like isoform X1 [Talpa occidentalis]|uniref:nascent polypeptide-associated complex subunit alpha, muscle-specific form-like isoform X1 n=1 Tax=Talpa occidentalis TaxID=50954 RepID=UPI0023F68612|nr:nascent polypeptide-associated complex subunit alpha, muscle-specific form-like isoform X1 [Talpa occidentalis]
MFCCWPLKLRCFSFRKTQRVRLTDGSHGQLSPPGRSFWPFRKRQKKGRQSTCTPKEERWGDSPTFLPSKKGPRHRAAPGKSGRSWVPYLEPLVEENEEDLTEVAIEGKPPGGPEATSGRTGVPEATPPRLGEGENSQDPSRISVCPEHTPPWLGEGEPSQKPSVMAEGPESTPPCVGEGEPYPDPGMTPAGPEATRTRLVGGGPGHFPTINPMGPEPSPPWLRDGEINQDPTVTPTALQPTLTWLGKGEHTRDVSPFITDYPIMRLVLFFTFIFILAWCFFCF